MGYFRMVQNVARPEVIGGQRLRTSKKSRGIISKEDLGKYFSDKTTN